MVAHVRDLFLLQLEDARVVFNRLRFIECLAVFEALYAMGLSKASIESGRYTPQALMKLPDRAAFWEAETEMKQWRSLYPDLVRVSALVAQKEIDE